MDGFTDGFINFIPKKDLVPTPSNLQLLTIPNTIHRLVGKVISDQLQQVSTRTYTEAIGRHKKPSPTLTIRDLIPSRDVDHWCINEQQKYSTSS